MPGTKSKRNAGGCLFWTSGLTLRVPPEIQAPTQLRAYFGLLAGSTRLIYVLYILSQRKLKALAAAPSPPLALQCIVCNPAVAVFYTVAAIAPLPTKKTALECSHRPRGLPVGPILVLAGNKCPKHHDSKHLPRSQLKSTGTLRSGEILIDCIYTDQPSRFLELILEVVADFRSAATSPQINISNRSSITSIVFTFKKLTGVASGALRSHAPPSLTIPYPKPDVYMIGFRIISEAIKEHSRINKASRTNQNKTKLTKKQMKF